MATKSNTITVTDIIGNPTSYPAAWSQSGVYGNMLVVAEDGTSLLPNGVLTVFKHSKKVAIGSPVIYQVLKSTDSGVTWSLLVSGTHYTFNAPGNTIAFVTAPLSTDLIMVTYQAHTNMAIAGVNSDVLEVGSQAIPLNYHDQRWGAHLVYSCIGKVAIGNTASDSGGVSGVGFSMSKIFPAYNGSNSYLLNHGTVAKPEHGSIPMTDTNSPTVKVFPYLTRSNGKARLQLVFKEMKHNGTSWGDDSKFSIVDNVSTTTDNNAQTVLIGQKYCELPYFISAGE